MAQRRGFREYLAGLLAPRERNKTLTTLARAEPLTGAKLSAVQRLQFFLSESVWDPERVNDRRLELLLAAPLTELGWADFQVRSDIAIRHQALVNCAFSFCWAAALPPPGAAQAGREEKGHGQPVPAAPEGRNCPSATKLAHQLRAVRSWLTPATTLTRWWHAWSPNPLSLSPSTCSMTSPQATACSPTHRLDPTDYR